jgi:hypothetical protein
MATERKQHVELLIRSIIVGQQKGAFNLKDASALHKVISGFQKGDGSVKEEVLINALVQGVVIAQKAGAYSLADANSIEETIAWFDANKPTLDPIPEEPKIVEL